MNNGRLSSHTFHYPTYHITQTSGKVIDSAQISLVPRTSFDFAMILNLKSIIKGGTIKFSSDFN
jgi:hypothetical protein